MSEREPHHNTSSGTVAGNLIQARDVHGDVTIQVHPAAERSAPNTLPIEITDFTGRQEELLQLDRRTAVVAIDGMPGVGKTTLVVHRAHRLAADYPDGQLFIDLQAHSADEPPLEPAQAISRLLTALKATPVRTPVSVAEWGEVWRAELSGRRVLVVLDNATSTAQIEHLLPGSAGSLVMITGRRRLDGLRTRGIFTCTLDVLPFASAVALVTSVIGEQRASEDSTAVDEIVRLCGQLPLAVRLVAARLGATPGWRIADMAAELRDERTRLAVMRVENISVRLAFELSYRWLSDSERSVFRRLGLHAPGEFGLPVAVALGGTGSATGRDAMERLVDYSLVRETTRHRYRMHDLMREYARECASETDPRSERRQATARALDFYLHTALSAHAVLMPHRPVRDRVTEVPDPVPALESAQAAIDWCGLELDNLLSCRNMAAEFDLQPYLWRIPRAIAHYLGLVTRLKDAGQNYALGLSQASVGDDRQATADMTMRIAEINNARGNHAAAVDGFLGAREIYLELGERAAAADMLNRVGLCHRGNGRYDSALAEHHRSLVEHVDLGDAFGQAEAHYLIAMVHRNQGSYSSALDHHRQAMELYRDLGYDLGVARSLANIGVIHRLHKDYDAALECYPQALAIYRGTGDQRGVANTLNNMASALDLAGRTEEAFPLLREATEIFAAVGNPGGIADVRRVTARLRASGGSFRQAEAELRAALATYRTTRVLFGVGGVLAELAAVIRRDGRAAEALPLALESLAVFRDDVTSTSGKVTALVEVAHCLTATGDLPSALDHAGQAIALTAELGAARAAQVQRLFDDLTARTEERQQDETG